MSPRVLVSIAAALGVSPSILRAESQKPHVAREVLDLTSMAVERLDAVLANEPDLAARDAGLYERIIALRAGAADVRDLAISLTVGTGTTIQ